MKTCKQCRKTFSESEFHKDRSREDGLRNVCKSCDKASCLRYQRRNRKHIREYRREWARTHKKQVAEAGRRSRVKNIANHLILAAKYRARKKGLPFDLTEHRAQLSQRVNRLECEVSGVQLDPKAKKTINSISLDRVVPEKGYVYSNIRVVSFAVNCAMGTWGLKKLKSLAKQILARS